jgi:pantoate--beta-alanine ligase
MLQIADPRQLSTECERQRREGRRIGFVPTMGYLHEGHLSLVRRARELSDFVVVSIFVNPAQFGPSEDLERYPADLPGDLEKCRAEGVDCVFAPRGDQIYPEGFSTYVVVEGLTEGMCGASRPIHFRGVCTVVTKLFNLVGPCVAVFGEKDYQQLQVLRRMARDLNQPVEVMGSPIVREPDGLAMSSRNAYLSRSQRESAPCLYRALKTIQERLISGERITAAQAVAIARRIIEAEPETRVDYIEVRHAERLETLEDVRRGETVVALAVFVGETRLIDNIVL